MPISIESSASTFLRSLATTNKQISKLFEQLASGKRINSFADDPAGGVISEQLRANFRGISQEIQNLQNNISVNQIEEGAMGQVNDSLQRIRTLQVQGQSDTTTPEQQAALQEAINDELAAIQNIVDTTNFSGQDLIEPGTELAAALTNGINVTDDVAATDTIITEVNQQRADVGSEINSMYSQIGSLEVTFENTLSAFSQISDADMAGAISALVANQIKEQASVASLQNLANVSRQNVVQLLNNL